jgi:predicted dehydrogenase
MMTAESEEAKMLNAAIVGLGWWGKQLVRAVQGKSELIRFSRGVTLEPESARDFAGEMGLALGTSYANVLADPGIEAVCLATPHTRHRAQVEAAAAAGKHVYCEKPFALSKADAQAALVACRRAGVALGVGQNMRFKASVKALRDLAGAGAFGTIMLAEGNYSHAVLADQPADSWRSAAEETRAGGMTGMGIHVLDCFSYIVGPIRRIAARSAQRAVPLPAGDTTAALIEFQNGALGTLGTTIKTPYLWRIAICGSDAWAVSTSDTGLTVRRANGEPATMELPETEHIRLNLESFAAAALGRGTFHIGDAGILHTVAALEAVFRSAETDGAWQAVE